MSFLHENVIHMRMGKLPLFYSPLKVNFMLRLQSQGLMYSSQDFEPILDNSYCIFELELALLVLLHGESIWKGGGG